MVCIVAKWFICHLPIIILDLHNKLGCKESKVPLLPRQWQSGCPAQGAGLGKGMLLAEEMATQISFSEWTTHDGVSAFLRYLETPWRRASWVFTHNTSRLKFKIDSSLAESVHRSVPGRKKPHNFQDAL